MRIAVADIEADGLLDSATRVWCLAFKDINTGDTISFGPEEVKEGIDYMDSLDVCIMHNGIGYDWPLLEKLYGYQYKGSKVDTLVMSRLLDPKRTIPPNCPNRRVGPHSIEAWGWRVGRGKPEHNDWTQFSEEMLHRCREDVEIQHLVYEALMKEAKGGNWRNAFLMSFKLFEVLQKQEQYGWKVDRKYMEKCIHTLDRWIDRIDRALEPHLPLLVEVQEQKVKGEYKFVSKPFLKSGKYSRSVDNWYLTSGCCRDSHPVGGPFSRVSFRKLDLGSSNEVKAFLLSEGWEPAAWNYNSEGQRTSPILDKDDPFDGVQGGVGRLIVKRVQCRQRKSIIEGLIGIIRPDGRIASIVNNLAVTGRATHRGIVNIPKPGSFFGKQMRKMFICSEGKVLVGTDSDSCQLRMLGGRMGSEEYIQALVSGDKEKGTDLHSLTKKVGDIESRDLAKNVIYCVPMDTQILTRNGWKTRDQVKVGDVVLTYNQTTRKKEWKPILAIHEKEDEVIELSHGQSFTVRATRDHRWFVKQRKYLPNTGGYSKINGRYMDHQVRTTEELNSESNIICNAPMTPDVEGGCIDFLHPKFETNWEEMVCQASSEARRSFLAGFLVADGHFDKGRGSWTFGQLRNVIFEAALLAAAIEHDGRLNISSQYLDNGNEIMKVLLNKKEHTTMAKMSKKTLPRQKVWCISTENESFVMRQGDTITITGNCLLFGGGDDKLGRTAKKPGQGKELRDKLYRGFDGLGDLVENLTKEWRATAKRRFNPKFNRMEWYDGTITGLDGRPVKVPYEHQLLVYLLQSDEAIMMSAAYIKIDSDLQKRGYKWGEDYGIVCFYHDEVNIECRKEIASEVAAISEEAIAWAGRFFKIKCPHIGDSAIGKSWYEVH